jgi:hypothetical protein
MVLNYEFWSIWGQMNVLCFKARSTYFLSRMRNFHSQGDVFCPSLKHGLPGRGRLLNIGCDNSDVLPVGKYQQHSAVTEMLTVTPFSLQFITP